VTWRLRGYDTFEGGSDAWYDLPGEFATEEAAVVAAKARLEELEKSQPSASSGGQRGIQDEVHIVSPDGKTHRYFGGDFS
jgi:hypothetical protein